MTLEHKLNSSQKEEILKFFTDEAGIFNTLDANLNAFGAIASFSPDLGICRNLKYNRNNGTWHCPEFDIDLTMTGSNKRELNWLWINGGWEISLTDYLNKDLYRYFDLLFTIKVYKKALNKFTGEESIIRFAYTKDAITYTGFWDKLTNKIPEVSQFIIMPDDDGVLNV